MLTREEFGFWLQDLKQLDETLPYKTALSNYKNYVSDQIYSHRELDKDTLQSLSISVVNTAIEIPVPVTVNALLAEAVTNALFIAQTQHFEGDTVDIALATRFISHANDYLRLVDGQ